MSALRLSLPIAQVNRFAPAKSLDFVIQDMLAFYLLMRKHLVIKTKKRILIKTTLNLRCFFSLLVSLLELKPRKQT